MILSQTPLRISFFGGGTDLPSFTKKEYGCVISTGINKYIYLVIHPSFSGQNRIFYMKQEMVDNIEDIKNTRVKEAMRKTGVIKGVEIHSLAEVPSGTGLGSSSAFTVGLLNLLYTYQGKYFSKRELAEQACEIEIDILKEPIGKQDQYASALGGINFIEFNPNGEVVVEPIRTTRETLEKLNKNLLMFYLDKTRDASKILEEQSKNIDSDEKKFEVLKKMKEITLKMKEELNNNKIDNFGKMLHESWMLKKTLTNSISNLEIDEIYKRGLKAGATGGKILGAGGGGFILFYCEPDKQKNLKEALGDLRFFDFKFEKEGAKIIYSQ